MGFSNISSNGHPVPSPSSNVVRPPTTWKSSFRFPLTQTHQSLKPLSAASNTSRNRYWPHVLTVEVQGFCCICLYLRTFIARYPLIHSYYVFEVGHNNLNFIALPPGCHHLVDQILPRWQRVSNAGPLRVALSGTRRHRGKAAHLRQI